MCFNSGPKVDNTIQRQQLQESQEARQREEERQARIRSGTDRINQTFSAENGLGDDFYAGRRQAVMDYYQPQIDDKFQGARDQMLFSLARAGTVNSSVAAEKQTQLQRDYDTQVASTLSKASNEESALRSRVNSEKSALVAQLNATGDADRASSEALARTQVIAREQPAYDVLPDIFAGVTSGIGGFASGMQNAQAINAFNNPGGTPRRSPSRTIFG